MERRQAGKGPAAPVVAQYLDRIVRDLEAGRVGHVTPQLRADLWADVLERLGVPDPLAKATLEVLHEIRAEFDPDDPSSYPAVRETLTELRESWGA